MPLNSCTECHQVKECKRYVGDGELYCFECTRAYRLRCWRCISFSAVYEHDSGRLLGVGDSMGRDGCAERQALWNLDPAFHDLPKILLVCRSRRNRTLRKASFGNSMPCAHCLHTMAFFNIVRVGYSVSKTEFAWIDIVPIGSNACDNDAYTTKNKSIIKTTDLEW